jgi:hypothetical protein
VHHGTQSFCQKRRSKKRWFCAMSLAWLHAHPPLKAI